MSDQPDNLVLKILHDMREEAAARDEKTQAQIGILAQGQISMRAEIQGMRGEIQDIRADLRRMSGHMQEIAMAIDHHTTRLDKIEHHLGLNQPKH